MSYLGNRPGVCTVCSKHIKRLSAHEPGGPRCKANQAADMVDGEDLERVQGEVAAELSLRGLVEYHPAVEWDRSVKQGAFAPRWAVCLFCSFGATVPGFKRAVSRAKDDAIFRDAVLSIWRLAGDDALREYLRSEGFDDVLKGIDFNQWMAVKR